MIIKKAILMGAVILCSSMNAQADRVFGLFLGAYSWNTDYSGTISSSAQLPPPLEIFLPEIDVKDDLGLSESTEGVYYFSLEHFVPLVPNVKLMHSDISSSAIETVDKLIALDGNYFGRGQDIRTAVDLSHTDLTLYYQVLDNWVELDLGLSLRVFNGQIDMLALSDSRGGLLNEGTRSTIDIDIAAPLLYGAAQFNLPLSGLYVSLDANLISYSGNSITDINLNAGYSFDFGLGLMLGYRTFSMELDDIHDLYADIQLDGPYGAFTFHF